MLYDLEDIRTKKITDISLTMASESPQRSAETSVTDNISQANSDVKEKYSRQLNNTADNIEQLKAENESFSEYVDEVVQELQSKLKNKKQPDVVKIFDRKELYKTAAKYNTYYEPNINGGFSKKQYSNAEIADIIENVLSEVSQGKTNVQDAVTRLTAIQENVLQNGYEIEYEPGAKEFRKELRNKPIYLTARDYICQFIVNNYSCHFMHTALIQARESLPDIKGTAIRCCCAPHVYSRILDVI